MQFLSVYALGLARQTAAPPGCRLIAPGLGFLAQNPCLRVKRAFLWLLYGKKADKNKKAYKYNSIYFYFIHSIMKEKYS